MTFSKNLKNQNYRATLHTNYNYRATLNLKFILLGKMQYNLDYRATLNNRATLKI